MRVNRDNKNLIITFVYNPALVDIVGKIAGRKFNNNTKEWTVPLIHVKKVLDTLVPLGFSISQSVLDLYNDSKWYYG